MIPHTQGSGMIAILKVLEVGLSYTRETFHVAYRKAAG